MTSHLERDLDQLKQRVLAMGGLVEQSLDSACSALTRRDEAGARRALAVDQAIDRLQLRVDDDCLKILALHQPVAGDLRFVTSAMKIGNDLERIGDLAVNIAERTMLLLGWPPLDEALEFEEMMSRSAVMLHEALDAFVAGDSDRARRVTRMDDAVDDLNRRHFALLQARMKRDPDSVERAVALLSITRNVERIADLAVNLAEDVVFLVEAIDIRHPGLEPRATA
jgi:phosphate transport system protein